MTEKRVIVSSYNVNVFGVTLFTKYMQTENILIMN